MSMFWTILCFVVCVSTDLGRHSVLATSDVQPQDDAESSAHFEAEGIPPAMLQELLWFFRRDDSTAWSYCILGLSVLVLLVGLVLLAKQTKENRTRKSNLLHKEGVEGSQPDETEIKQAFLPLKEDSNSSPQTDNFIPKAENAGQVMVQWKDGNVTTLYTDAAEEDV